MYFFYLQKHAYIDNIFITEMFLLESYEIKKCLSFFFSGTFFGTLMIFSRRILYCDYNSPISRTKNTSLVQV